MSHSGIDTSTARLEGLTLVIRVPLHFQRHGGRKLIVGPDGEENWAPLRCDFIIRQLNISLS